jgi:hypothetical protein
MARVRKGPRGGLYTIRKGKKRYISQRNPGETNPMERFDISKRVMGFLPFKDRKDFQFLSKTWFVADKNTPVFDTVPVDNQEQLVKALKDMGDTLTSLTIHFKLSHMPNFDNNKNIMYLNFIGGVDNLTNRENQIVKLPSQLKYLVLRIPTRTQIPVGYLPSSLTHLKLGDNFFNSEIIPGSLPDGIQELHFGRRFNKPIGRQNLPKSLRILVLGDKFRQEFDTLPSELELLSLGCEYGGMVLNKDILPGSLKVVVYACSEEEYIMDDDGYPNGTYHLLYNLLKNPVNSEGKKFKVIHHFKNVSDEELIEGYEWAIQQMEDNNENNENNENME